MDEQETGQQGLITLKDGQIEISYRTFYYFLHNFVCLLEYYFTKGCFQYPTVSGLPFLR